MKKLFITLIIICFIIPAISLASVKSVAPVCYPSSCVLVQDTTVQTSPRISGSNVIWQSGDGTLSYINLVTKERRIISGSPVGGHEIDGTKVVYSMNSQIYLYDITTNITTQITHIIDGTGAGSPSINGNYISWYQSSLSGSYSIFLYNIATDKIKQITEGVRPVVYGNKIVFEKIANGAISDIYLYDIPTGISSKIGTGNMPRVYGDYVIWFGSDTSSGVNLNPITLYQISTQTQKIIGEGGYVRIYGDRVVSWGSVDRKLHVYVISSGQTISGFGDDRGDGGGWTDPDIYKNTVVFGGNTGIYYVTLPKK